jgi:predicted acylesterase/phospholipase RssA
MTDGVRTDCDIVMKGGITSGVVYPLAALHLSERYKFRHVGGASAGAIAAAFVAAAERGHASGGFNVIGGLPEELGKELPYLFQPSKPTTPAFNVLMNFVEPDRGAPNKVVRALGTCLRASWGVALGVFVVLMLPGFALALGFDGRSGDAVDWGNVLQLTALWSPLAFVAMVVAAVFWTARKAISALEHNGFGLCDGHTATIRGHLPLTDWMTEKLDLVAGPRPDDRPLTFGDLWGKAAVDAFNLAVKIGTGMLDLTPIKQREVRADRIVDLEVMTTNLTLCRPYRFPFESRDFYFCEKCFRKYFPETVVEHMTLMTDDAKDKPPRTKLDGTEHGEIKMRCPLHHDIQVRYFPRPPDVPVVVAARLSLSFPALISAVPLYYVDYGRHPDHIKLITVWFSDGGIASNFPVQLFDSMWPTRPTFAIDLQPLDKLHGSQTTYLPTRGYPRSHEITSMFGFGHGILNTMQNWVDITQLTLPAYRNRVAEIRLTAEQGGMNLRMPAEVIREIAALGRKAAGKFDKFSLPDHQTKRFQTSMAMLDDMLTGLKTAADKGFDRVIDASDPSTRAAAAHDVLKLANAWTSKHQATAEPLPHPNPDLRLVPRQ